MDISKAFDMMEWGQVFVKPRYKWVNQIYLKFLIFIYRNQQCNVEWTGKYFSGVSVSDGV